MLKKLKPGVFWDMDGTLLDSEKIHIEKHIHCAALFDVELSFEEYMKKHDFSVFNEKEGQWLATCMTLHGAGDKNMYYWVGTKNPKLFKELSLKDWLKLEQVYYDAHAIDVAPRKDILTALNRLSKITNIQAMVTSATQEQIQVNKHGLKDIDPYLLFKVCAEDVAVHKPAPDCYLLAREKAQFINKSDLNNSVSALVPIAIEDSPTGVASALSAGFKVIQYLLPGQTPFKANDTDKFFATQDLNEGITHLINNWL